MPGFIRYRRPYSWRQWKTWIRGRRRVLPLVAPAAAPEPPLTVPSVATRQIISNADDVLLNGGTFVDFVEYVGNLGLGPAHSAYRFQRVPLPRGAVIVSAYMNRYLPVRTGTGSLLTKYDAEAADDPSPITSAADWDTRVHTSASVNSDNLQTGGGWIPSVDLRAIIQEVVDRPGWQSGQSLIVFQNDRGSDPGNYILYSYDFNGGVFQFTAQLVVLYHSGYEDRYGYTIPAPGDNSYNFPSWQSRPSTPCDEDIRVRQQALGDGVRFGARVVATDPETFQVQLGYGQLVIRGRTLEINQQPVTPVGSDPSLPRMDLIVAADTGDTARAYVVPGAASDDPYPPLPPKDTVALATLTLEAGATVVRPGDLVDKRIFVRT